MGLTEGGYQEHRPDIGEKEFLHLESSLTEGFCPEHHVPLSPCRHMEEHAKAGNPRLKIFGDCNICHKCWGGIESPDYHPGPA